MQDLRISIIQTNLVWENKEANLQNLEKEILALGNNQDLIVLPEMFNTAFSMKPKVFAEKPESDTHQWMYRMSQQSNSAIAGSFMVKESGNYYNRFIIMNTDGSYKKYDKHHLFRMGGEHNHFSAGRDELIFELNGWKIKAMICYDLRFPVFAKNNFKNGKYDYDVLIYVANWPKVRNHIWETLLLARALENQCYVIGVNRIGKDGNELDHAGSSCIINSKGEYIIEPRHSEKHTSTATISYANIEDFRNNFTVGLDWDGFLIKEMK